RTVPPAGVSISGGLSNALDALSSPCIESLKEQYVLDENDKYESEFLSELTSFEKVDNSIVTKLQIYNKDIAQYKIIFLHESNEEVEWKQSEDSWSVIEDRIVKSISEIVSQDIKNLLEKYNESIKNSLTGINIDISKVAMTVNENTFSKQTDYNLEEIGLSNQKSEQRRAICWSHDAALSIKITGLDFRVGCGEVVGNPCFHNDNKYCEDREKLLKERDFRIYSTHWVNGLYLVDQVDRFEIPDNADQIDQLSSIIEVMLAFKFRVKKLKQYIEGILDAEKLLELL
ncbi:17958_t:CDS:2, partial [Funneliformis geosporum]